MSADPDYAGLARQSVEAAARGADEVAALLADDVLHEEFPNRLLPGGATRDLAAIREAGERGKRVMAGQHYEVLNVVAAGAHVALEARWTGTLAMPLDSLPPGARCGRGLRCSSSSGAGRSGAPATTTASSRGEGHGAYVRRSISSTLVTSEWSPRQPLRAIVPAAMPVW